MPHRECTRSKHNAAKSSNQIRIPSSREDDDKLVEDNQQFRDKLDEWIAMYPELFPPDIEQGYQLYGFTRPSVKMPEVKRRRIRLAGSDGQESRLYTIVPSYALPYMAGDADDVEKALFLRRFGVPFWALTSVFGRNDMYWQRLTPHLGRNDIVGTTLKDPELLPDHLLGDEKHTRWNGGKAYIATTVAQDCVLGVSITLAADEAGLTEAYGHFKHEAQRLHADYQPQTINTDGWKATQSAWQSLFPTMVIIPCFLHAFLSIRARCKRLQDVFPEIKQRVWDIYHADEIQTFQQRLTDLSEWAHQQLHGAPLEAVLKLCAKADLFACAFDHPYSHRTSNMIDRHLDPLDRCLYTARYFHGHLMSAEYQLRAWALFHNFQPFCPRAKVGETYRSPFHKLNGFVYHENWLQNLLVATSLGGCSATNSIR